MYLSCSKKEHYIKDFAVIEDGKKKSIDIELMYENNKPVLRGLKLFSKPGRRMYKGIQELKPVLGGLGLSVVSTSKGVMTDKQARAAKIGGEILFQIW
ncbi:MAG: 30S ribosomal protein S8 [Microgenomates bacterium OLB23]|nr:MAG: 30S ribosomal protein S8 [Microgenomates bacterium OLB23]